MGMIAQQIPKGLDGQDSAVHGLFVLNGSFIDGFKRRPPAPAEFRQQLTVVQKVPPQNFRDAEHHMPVRNRFYNVPAQPFAELNHTLLVARRAEMATFARKSKQILMAAIPATHPGKAVLQNAAIQVTVDDLLDVGT